MDGERIQLSANAREDEIARRTLENLRRVREQDTASFDQMLGGITQDPNLVQAYIDHENGRRYQRGLKKHQDLTALERYSMNLPLTDAQRRELANRRRRPVEGG